MNPTILRMQLELRGDTDHRHASPLSYYRHATRRSRASDARDAVR